MRPSPAGPLSRLHWPALALLLLVSACDRRPPTGIDDVRRIGLDIPSFVLRPGSSMMVHASPLDANDAPVNVAVTWHSLTPSLLAVSNEGLLFALAPGIGRARASVGSVFADVAIDLVNPPAASIMLGVDSVTVTLPTGELPLVAVALDTDGEPLVGATPQWSSTADRIATVSASGVVRALAVGVATVRVMLDGQVDSVVVSVVAEATPSSPLITSVLPAVMQPGVPVVLQGERFAPTVAGNSVRVDGVAVTVTAASMTALTVVLPVVGAPCLPTRPVALQVTTAGGIGVTTIVLQSAPRLALAPGDAFAVLDANTGACQELEVADGEYVVAITHAGRALGGGPIGVTLAGRVAPGATTGPLVAAVDALVSEAVTPARASVRSGAARRSAIARWRATAHRDLLAASHSLLNASTPRVVNALDSDASLQLPVPGGIVQVRVPDLDSPTFCSNFVTVGARTVFSGAHVVILEDTASVSGGGPTLAGQMDGEITALGAEIEAVIWPLLLQFGDPLVMDSRLDANGRVAVLLTPRMNAMRDGALLGAVVSCDFFPRAQLPSSNVGEILYLQVPRVDEPGFGEGNREHWRWQIRSTVAHELKHIVSFGERTVRGHPLEELWLEEATARHSEELYARSLYAVTQRADAQYEATVRCEVRESGPPAGCGDIPRLMRAHIEGLAEFLEAPTSRSPLGGSAADDQSFYGSAWALTRWAFDQSAQSESAILGALTTSSQSGVANLEARVGLPWDVMLSLWSLAMLTDGTPGLAPSSPQLTFPSWDLTDIFAGLFADGILDRAHPAQPIERATGNFDLAFPEIAPGGFAAIRISGTVSTGRQLLVLSGLTGTLPPTVRLSVIRVR